MNELFGILKATLEEGFVYAILAYGVYITYSILDFPDLSVDGTVPLGAVLTGVLILQGSIPGYASCSPLWWARWLAA